MPNIAAVLLRSTRALQPLATAVPVHALYCVTDEGNIIEQSDGSAWAAFSPDAASAAGLKETLYFVIDNDGSVLTTGVKGYLVVPFNCTITAARLFADQSGSVVIDIWKDSYANFPPLVADTITASAKPTISTGVKDEDTTLTGWTTGIVAGDVLGFNVDSVTTHTRVTVQLTVQRT